MEASEKKAVPETTSPPNPDKRPESVISGEGKLTQPEVREMKQDCPPDKSEEAACSWDDVKTILVTLAFISKQLQKKEDCELSSEDLDNVAGGFAITLTVTTVLAIVGGASATGAAIGGAIWYWKHRKCQPE